MFLTSSRIKRINFIVSLLAAAATVSIFQIMPRSAFTYLFHELRLLLLLFVIGIIILTALFINRLNNNRIRMEEQMKLYHVRKQYRDLFEMALDPIVVHDVEGNIESANNAAAELIGITREQMEKDNLFRYISSGQCSTEPNSHWPTTGFSSLSLARPDGKSVRAEAVSTRFVQDGREKYMQIIRDVTDKELFEERKRVLEKLATLGQMASKISHEISNPLTAIINYSEVGKSKTSDNSLAHFFERIKAQAELITKITRNYLDFAHPSRGMKKAEDPAAVIQEALSFFLLTSRGKNMKIREQIEAGLPPIFADKNKIIQVLLNLFVNSLHATEYRQEPLLTVRAFETKGENSVIIKVKDNGTGIPPENFDRVFEPHFTTKPEGKGTGIGLSIVKEIVQDEHNGRIEIASKSDKGTTVTITLPSAKKNAPPEALDKNDSI